VTLEGKEEKEEKYINKVNKSQISWRELSCLTRVLPDVSKSLAICYVIKSDSEMKRTLEFSSKDVLNQLQVRILGSMVRRFECDKEGEYVTMKNVHEKFQKLNEKKKRKISSENFNNVIDTPNNFKKPKKRKSKIKQPISKNIAKHSKYKKTWDNLMK